MARGIERPVRTYLRAAKPVENQIQYMLAVRAAELRGALAKKGLTDAQKRRITRRHITRLYRDVAPIIYLGEQKVTDAAVLSMNNHHAIEDLDNTKTDMKVMTGREGNLDHLLGLMDSNKNKALRYAHRDDVADMMNPGKPGGISYSIMRIARSELSNTFQEVSYESTLDSTRVVGYWWRLSSTHPGLDICNILAEGGPYHKGNVPKKPHPFCLCFLEPQIRVR